MRSTLMPADSDKNLHLKLLDLFDDANTQYDAIIKLQSIFKMQEAAQKDLSELSEKFSLLPSKEFISNLTKKEIGTPQYTQACKTQYFKFLEFYVDLEQFILRHYKHYKHTDKSDYLKTVLAKLLPHTRQRSSSLQERKRPEWLQFHIKTHEKKDAPTEEKKIDGDVSVERAPKH